MDNGTRQEFICLIKAIKGDHRDDEKDSCISALKEFLDQHLCEESVFFSQTVKEYIEDLLVKSSTSHERSAGILLVNWALRLSSGSRNFFSDGYSEDTSAVVMISDDGKNPLYLATLCKIIEPTFREFPNNIELLSLAADTLEEILARIGTSINLSAVTDSVEDLLKTGLEMLSGMPFGSITTSAKSDSLKCLSTPSTHSRNTSMNNGFLGRLLLSQQAQIRRSLVPKTKTEPESDMCIGGVFIVRAVARAVPGVFGHYVGKFVSIVRIPLGNNSLEIREKVHQTLCEVLKLYGKRDIVKSKAWFDELFEIAKKTLDPKKKKNPVLVHSALLLFDALIENMPFSIKEDHLKFIMEKLFLHQKNKDPIISNVSMSLFPKIAKISPDFFINDAIITPTLDCILQVLTKNSDKASAFVALGELVAVLGTKLSTQQIKMVTDCLSAFLDNQKLLSYVDDAMECITNSLVNSLNELCKMSSSLKSELQHKIFNLLKETLSKCLLFQQQKAQSQFHSQTSQLQQQQLQRQSQHKIDFQQQQLQQQKQGQQQQQQLAGQSMQYAWKELLFKRPPIVPANTATELSQGAATEKYGSGAAPQNRRYPLLISTQEPREGDPEVAILALKTLTVFDVSEHDVLDFADDTVVHFLENDSSRVQQGAALACISLMLASAPEESGLLPVRGHASGHIESLLLKLIDKAVSSADLPTRLVILRSLSPRFDSHLVRDVIVENLFLLLGDESFEVQESVITIIGRLIRNPLMVSIYPRLKNFLADLVCALRFSRDVRTKLWSSMLLERLLHVAPRLGFSYADSILPALMPQLSSPNIRINTAAMTAIGELAAAFSPQLVKFQTELMVPIMGILRDKTTTPEHVARRQATVHTLGELIKATATAVSTMRLYPAVRRILFESVSTEREPSLRMELIRLIGIIGAADPYYYREIHLQESRKITKAKNARTSAFSLPIVSVDNKDYNTFIVISALSKILNDSSLVCCHTNALKCLQVVLHIFGNKIVEYMDILVEPLIVLLKECGSEQRVEVVNCLVVVTMSLKHLAECYVLQIAELIQKYWDETTLISNLVLMEYFAKYLNDIAKPAIVVLMPRFMESLEEEVQRPSKNTAVLGRYIEAIEILAPQIEEFHCLIFPLLNSLLNDSETPVEIACKYLLMAGRMCASANISSSVSSIIAAILRLMNREVQSPTRIISSIMESLTFFARYSPSVVAPFVPTICRTLQRYKATSKEFSKLMSALTNLHVSGTVPATLTISDHETYDNELEICETKIRPLPLPKLLPDEFDIYKKLSINTSALRNVLEMSVQAHTKDDWIEWQRQYSLVLLQCSPSPQLRVCYELAQEYHPLVQDLFPAAFIACWDELSDRDYLLCTLARVIEKPDVPQEVTQALLDVLEFLERKERPFFAEPLPTSRVPLQTSARNLASMPTGRSSPVIVPSTSPPPQSPKMRHRQQQQQQHDIPDGYCWPFGDPRSQMSFEKMYAASYRCRAYAKALRLKEIIYQENPESIKNVEDLINTNNMLQIYDASRGIFVQARKTFNFKLTAGTYEKLREWSTALSLYEKRLSEAGNDLDAQLGCMRCLRALGDTRRVVEIASATLQHSGLAKQQQREIAEIGGRAGMMVEDWDFVERCMRFTPEESVTRMLFQSLLSVHSREYDVARSCILKARAALDTEVSALLSESYERAYPSVICAQQLSEMEQVIDYLETDDERKRETIRTSFKDNLVNTVVYEVDAWQSILNVHALCIDRTAYPEMWIKFAGICRKQSRPALAVQVLEGLAGMPFVDIPANVPCVQPSVALAAAKVMWYQGMRAAAVGFVEDICKHLTGSGKSFDSRAAAKTLLYLGMWKYEIAKAGGFSEICENVRSISEVFDSAVHYQSNWHKALHTWALFNCDLVAMCQAAEEADEKASRANTPSRSANNSNNVSISPGSSPIKRPTPHRFKGMESQGYVGSYSENVVDDDECYNDYYDVPSEKGGRYESVPRGTVSWGGAEVDAGRGSVTRARSANRAGDVISERVLEKYLVVALESLVESIKLAGRSTLQDMLRLVSLGLNHGHRACTQRILATAVSILDGSLWVQVIPQVISQMHTPTAGVQRFISDVIMRVCEQHPQTIVYPLIVAAKSRHSARQRDMARRLFENLRTINPRVANQAEVFARELARLSLNWYEIWFVGLDNAYRQYTENDTRGMRRTFSSLFKMYNRKAETPLEQNFIQRLGAKVYGLSNALHEGGDFVSHMRTIYGDIDRYGMSMQNLSLRQCAPLLLQEDFSSLCIPGTYAPSEANITIAAISRNVPILSSKQRPRKLVLTGSNGVRYQFLLKAREDLRQDERAMQFFGLVNMLLEADSTTRKDHLGIVRYAVVPLSPSVGIIGWVLHSTTIYDLVKEYRKIRDIPFDIEYDTLNNLVPEYDMLTTLQKVEVMQRVMECTTGNDLKHIMWLHSANSEEWLQRRLRYARSLAVTSVSGHILGLGDRHPGNIMIDKDTGDVIHIDLGDCFEVAMHRLVYPEHIPFRLTRMFINALEASGVEGSFRFTCEKVLAVLRDNKESLLTVLETFVYDPLLNWRITKANKSFRRFEQSHEHTSTMGSLSTSSMAIPASSFSSVAKLAPCMANGLAFHLNNIIQDDDDDEDDDEDDDYDDNGDGDNDYEYDGCGSSCGKNGVGRNSQHIVNGCVNSPCDFQDEAPNDDVSIRKNPLALAMMKKVTRKLNGSEGKDPRNLNVSEQVDALIHAATDPENVASSFKGWAPFW